MPDGLSDVKAIYSTKYAFAALKEYGTVAAWGGADYGGSGVPDGLSGVKAIYGTGSAFAAVREEGTGGVWGAAVDVGGASASAVGGGHVRTSEV